MVTHSTVFRLHGGIGKLRSQEVIEMPALPEDFGVAENGDGTTTLGSAANSVTYDGETPELRVTDPSDDGDDEVDYDDDDEDGHHADDDDQDSDSCDYDDNEDDNAPAPSGPVVGTPQDDILLGTSGGDLVFGLAGVDHIVTGAEADVFRAGTANDFIDGEAGQDVLFGEMFGWGPDTIRGFQAGDKIDLSGIDANTGTVGNNTFTLGGQTTTAPGQVAVTHETREDGECTVISAIPLATPLPASASKDIPK